MIIQITRTKNEAFLIKEMLPIWKKYADGFVFLSDNSTDDTIEYLKQVSKEYNILEILETNYNEDSELKVETNERQYLYDTALKYSNNIICLDTDEYLDGSFTKQELEDLLKQHPDALFWLQWIQYTDKTQIRVDGPWGHNFKDRIGTYISRAEFTWTQMHSLHLPTARQQLQIPFDKLFIAHLQWLDKRWVGIKQYFWKVTDYVTRTKFKTNTLTPQEYDVSVANFNWKYADIKYPLRVPHDIYSRQDVKNNFKLQYIVTQTNLHNIPNLNDWGMGIYEYALQCKDK